MTSDVPPPASKRIADLVHEGAHVEDSAAARFHQVLRVQGVAHRLRIKSRSLVRNRDGEIVAVQLEGGIDLLLDVELVAVFDGIGDRLAHGHADPVRAVLIHPRVFTEMFRDHLHELDILESTADGDLDPLAVTFHSVLNRRHCKG